MVNTNRVVDGPQEPHTVSKPSAAVYKYPKAPDAVEQSVELNKSPQGEPPAAPERTSERNFHKYSAFVPANKIYDKMPGNGNVGNYYKQFQPWNQYFGPQPDYYPNPEGRGNYIETDYDREGALNAANSPIFWPLSDAQRIDQRQIGGMRPPVPPPNGFGPPARQEPPAQWAQPGLDYYQRLPGQIGFGAAPPGRAKSDAQSDGSPAKISNAPTPAPTDKPVKPMVTSYTYSRLAAASKPAHAAPLAVSHLRDTSSTGRDTNSAVIALTLGLCITAMLVGLVGCRMKSIKRRIARRGGRSLTHDADYLVNGMYL